MKIPLDEKTTVWKDPETGKSKTLPVLDPRWKEEVQFVMYHAPPKDESLNSADYQEWMERITFIEEDLHSLLALSHDKFWCQAIFDETLQMSLESYLRYAPRTFDGLNRLPDSAKEKHLSVHRLVFMTFLRLATFKESKDAFITPHIFGEILYENFIFDIPKMMDLCVLYAKGNLVLLQKMVDNIFTQQPKYEDDLRATIPSILQVFENISLQCGVKCSSTQGSPEKLSVTKIKPTDEDVRDVVSYLYDTCMTLHAFLEVHPQAGLIFHEQHVETRLASFYEAIPTKLKEMMKDREFGSLGILVDVRKKLHRSKVLMIKLVRQILFTAVVQPILELNEGSNHESLIEDYLQVLAGLISEKRFIADYEAAFPLDDDLDILTQSTYIIDETRIEFLQEAIADASFTHGKKRRLAKIDRGSSPEAEAGPSYDNAGAGEHDDTAAYERLGACAASVSGIELDSLICAVKDLLPHLGPGFIQVCLEEFNYNTEDVINALLEGKLTPGLEELDPNMERAVSPPSVPSVLDTRHNIYDGDEFDVFRRENVDISRVHKGKKNVNEDMAALDDKRDLDSFRDVYNMYGNMDATESMYEMKNIEYDDEYDDTYDSHEVGADDADSADELTKKFVVNRLNPVKGHRGSAAAEQDEEEEEEEESSAAYPHRPFVEDPAKIRERQAQRYANRHSAGHGKRVHDVKGQAKGKGQEKDVLHNRQFKDQHKSRLANHNRRAMADRKRQKGMGPLA
ncbi:activating signal cointegrator 1 complex subunit 2-like [Lineus longissimus]|uniref:activating signal cointegrator 1 complex subunit 2-like n=1 Tax=Lineus longissimus TaxID=88925 RepID=UPI002B4C9090